MNSIVFSLTFFHARIPPCVWQSCLLSLFQFTPTSLSFLIFSDLALSLSFLIFFDLDTLEDIAQLLCRKYCIGGLLMFAHSETKVVCYWEKHPGEAPSPRVGPVGVRGVYVPPSEVALDLSLMRLSQVLPENPLLFLLIEYLGGWQCIYPVSA